MLSNTADCLTTAEGGVPVLASYMAILVPTTLSAEQLLNTTGVAHPLRDTSDT